MTPTEVRLTADPKFGLRILRVVGFFDLIVAVLLVATPVVSSRIGRPLSWLLAAIMTTGAILTLWMANRRAKDLRSARAA